MEPIVKDGIARGDLDPTCIEPRAYADWVTRILVAVILVPGSSVIDIRDPVQVADYVRTHLLAGRPPA